MEIEYSLNKLDHFFYFLHLLHSTLVYSSFEMVGMITIIYSNC